MEQGRFPRDFQWDCPLGLRRSIVRKHCSDGTASQKNRGETARTGGNAVIRQAISCDICAMEKRQTNHWFVALEQGGELRVSGFSSRTRLRPGMKHLCGQTCLHKLVDEFMARTIAVRVQAGIAEEPAQNPVATIDASLTSDEAFEQADFAELESSARLIPAPESISPKRAPFRAPAELVAMPERQLAESTPTVPAEPPRYTSRNWRAEAWDRERERGLRAVERRTDISPRRRSGS
jgi:hypothetical protein